MLPGGMNPKQMKKMMQRMGVKMDEVPAEEVIIRGLDAEIRITEPQVIRTVVQGKEMFQISGKILKSDIEADVEISEEDVRMVAEQANVPESDALKALQDAKGDIAQAIIDLKG
ncbi:MAG: nascent polypeptide-associated complex protein [Candidatus Altiarchaeota archaeon]